MSITTTTAASSWPELRYEQLQPTCSTLHLWMQIVGKVRLVLTPWVNHSWHATFYLTSRGMTTSPIPYEGGSFQIDFDFLDQKLIIQTSDGAAQRVPLVSQSVADFYAKVFDALAALGVSVRINTMPSEIPDSIPFEEDTADREYDAATSQQFWRALGNVDRVFKQFRTGFLGKVSPVHVFWGAPDLAVTRFSGRRAPLHAGGVPGLSDAVSREAYSHEVSSAGFWPGGGFGQPAFYSYAYPEPAGFRDAAVMPEQAMFSEDLGEFVLPYAAVRNAQDPDATLLSFLQSTYDAAASLGDWPRAELECPVGRPCVPRAV